MLFSISFLAFLLSAYYYENSTPVAFLHFVGAITMFVLETCFLLKSYDALGKAIQKLRLLYCRSFDQKKLEKIALVREDVSRQF